MEVSGRRQAGSDTADTTKECDICRFDDKIEHAEHFCTDCNEFLCLNCARVHRRSKTSKHHRLLNKDEMPSSQLESILENMCTQHDGKTIEYYCQKHSCFCCSVCVTLGHRQCHVDYIADVAKDFKTSREYADLVQRIEHVKKQATETHAKARSNGTDVEKYFNQLVHDVRQFKKEITSRLEKLVKELLQQAEQIKSTDLKTMDSIIEISKKIEADLSEIKLTLQSLETYKQNQQLFISSKHAQMKVLAYQKDLEESTHKNNVNNYTFKRNEDTMRILQNASALGTIDIKSKIERRQTEKREVIPQNIVGKGDPKSIRARLVKKINVKHTQDRRTCWIWGCVKVTDNTLAVVDYTNSSVKVIDVNTDTIKCYIELEIMPWDIACLDRNTLIVTCNTVLVYLRYDGNLTVIRRVPMESWCKGIACNKGKLFVTFEGEQPAVMILDDEGRVLKAIKKNEKGENLFEWQLYIALSKDTDTIYVSDFNKQTITSLDMEGRVCNVYKHDELKGLVGLTVDREGNIYVAGGVSHNIHLCTAQCEPVQILLDQKDGIENPMSVFCDDADNMLYVSFCDQDSLSVYKLE